MPDTVTSSTLDEVKISDLPAATQANTTDLLEASQVDGPGFTSRSVTLDQVATAVAGSDQITDVIDSIELLPGPPGAAGSTGPPGPAGAAGPGVPAGGTANQALTKINSTDFNTQWTTLGGGTGTVTSVSVVSANGLAGTVATPTATPAITLSTTITGMLKGNGIAISAGVAGTDYMTPGNVSGAYLPIASPAFTGTMTGPAVTLSGALASTTATFSGGLVNITGTTNPNFVVYNSTVGGFGLFAETGTSGQMVIYRATTAGAWAENYAVLNATSATFSKPVIAPGAQIQMVSTQTGAVATGTTLIPFDDTIPQITEGNEYMTLAITPKSATSRLIIEVILVGSNTAISSIIVALFQDSTANALAATTQTIAGANQVATVPLRHTMTSGTTGSTTFRVRAGASAAGTTTFNGNASARAFGGVLASSIVIREVAT